ncbi:MAG: hypothetical protein HZA54_19385 [Planctomycetes bacterium]|nr:hypothetical protein [Planctomycetota bacterium]
MSADPGEPRSTPPPSPPATAAPAPPPVLPTRVAGPLFALLLSAFLLTASPRPDTYDGVVRLELARALVTRHALDIPPVQFAHLPYTWPARDGKHYPCSSGLGHSLLLAALLALAGLPYGMHLANALSPLLMALGLLAFHGVQEAAGVPRRRAVAVTLIAAFTTPIWVYSRSWFEVAIEVAALNSALLCLLRAFPLAPPAALGAPPAPTPTPTPARRAALALAALAYGFALLTRVSSALALPGLALCALALRRRADAGVRNGALRGLARDAALVAPILALPVALLLAYNYLRFGDPWTHYHPEFQRLAFAGDRLRGLAGLLFSPWKSLFLFAPALLLALPGWRALSGRAPAVALAAGVTAAAYLFFYSGVGFWHGDRAWGPRYLVWLVPWLCLPLGFVEPLWRPGFPRAAAALLLGASAVVQFSGVSLWCIRFQNRVELVEGRAPFFVADTTNFAAYFRVAEGPIPDAVARVPGDWRQAFRFVPGPPAPELDDVWVREERGPLPADLVERHLRSDELYNVPFVWWVVLLRHETWPGATGAALVGLVAGLVAAAAILAQRLRHSP